MNMGEPGTSALTCSKLTRSASTSADMRMPFPPPPSDDDAVLVNLGQNEPAGGMFKKAIEADPTKDIHALRGIGFVMKGGDVIRNDAVARANAGVLPALSQP